MNSRIAGKIVGYTAVGPWSSLGSRSL